MNKKTSLKVLCLGNSQTGKTSFINRLVFNTFSDNVVSTIIGKNTDYKKTICLCLFGIHPVKSDFVL